MRKLLRLALFSLALFLPQPAQACTIPVFRYALEQWNLSTYDVLVYHRGPLPEDIKAALKPWSDAPSKANVEITLVDLEGKMTTEQQKLWEREGNKDAPAWMLVRLQFARVKDAWTLPSAWTGPCTAANLQNLLVSPARAAIRDQLAQGASVVFVLLTSGDAEADAKGLALLRKQLPVLEKRIKLPVQDDSGPKMRLPLPLKVSLPLMTLDRNDPREASLVRLLLATDEGLDKVKGPIVFPIFGRGRVFPSIHGEDFTDKIVFEVTHFLCKDCSCQVKELNPGVDLLLAADWSRIFDEMFEKADAVVPPQTAVKSPVPPQPATATISNEVAPKADPPPAPPTGSIATEETEKHGCPLAQNWLWIASGAAGVLVLGSGAWLLCSLRKCG
jgi:hypothetical protein